MNKVGVLGIVLVIILLGLVLWYSLSFLPSIQRAENLVVAGPFSFKLSFWDYLYAQHAGFFSEYNLNVSYIEVRSVSEMTQATLAGEIDLMHAVGDAIKPALAGAPLKVVLVIGHAQFCLIARAGINSVKDIKIHADIGGRGGDGDTLTTEYFLRNGMKENEDYSKIFTSREAIVPGMQTGDFDSCTAGGNSYTLRQIGGKQLVKFAEEFPQYCVGGFACTESTIKQKGEAIKNYLKAIYRSQTYLMEHREEAIEFANNTLGLELDYATFIYDFAYTNKYGAPFKITPGMPISDIEYTMKLCAKYNNLEEKQVTELVDTSLWDQAMQELGV
jgi:ABC-type nitrate/sulfonate/bicarbonate transport system substrate-binding protein